MRTTCRFTVAAMAFVANVWIMTAQAGDSPAYNVNDYYELHRDKRIYVFDDAKTYREFLDNGESPFRLTRIGAGKNGETIVFGLRSMDKGKPETEVGGVGLHDGNAQGATDSFYSEIVTQERVYVFEDWNSLRLFRETGDLALRQTEIGAGPDGQTVVFAISPANKDKKADALIARYQALHAKGSER